MASLLLEHMPDIVLIKVFNYLNTDDLLHLSECGDRIQQLCSEKLVVRVCSFEGRYQVKEEDLKKHVKKNCQWIQTLDLNHCYWWPPKVISWAIGKCKDLRELNVLECRIKIPALVPLIAALPRLRKLAFSVQSINDLRADAFDPCSETLKRLKRLYVYYSSRQESPLHYLGEQTTLLDHCEEIEEILISSAGMAIPELYRPLISYPHNFSNLKVMAITNNIHAGAQMLYYGTLSQVPNAQIRFKSLIMPNVNFPEFMRRPEYSDCLKHMEELQHLDIYGSRVTFPMEVIDIQSAVQLRHISLGASRINGPQLKNIANHCTKLTSINLYNCDHIFKGKPVYQGVEALFQCCAQLKHFNIGGEHHHFTDMVDGRQVLTYVKGLQSLCLSTCMLCEEKPEGGRRTAHKRVMSCRGGGYAPKRRCLQQSTSTASTSKVVTLSSSDEDSPDNEPSTSAGLHRVSHAQGEQTEDEAILSRLVRNNPDLTRLEIMAPDMISLIHQNHYTCKGSRKNGNSCVETRLVRNIQCIQYLTRLENLTLMGLPGLLSGVQLATIMKQCTCLKSLVVGFAGSAFGSSYFADGLIEMKNLVDLRLEQPNMCLNKHLFECISHCQKLERLCIIAKNSNFQQTDVSKLVEQLPLLVVLQLFAGGAVTTCKSITSAIHKKYHKSRPAMSCHVHPVMHEGITPIVAQIPAKHLDEFTRFSTRVATFPPGLKL